MDNLVSVIAIFASVACVVFQMRANHTWNRRKYALDMIAEWNDHMGSIKKKIQSVSPGISEGNNKISKDLANELLSADFDSDEKLVDIKLSIDALLNYFEFIATAYTSRVGDSAIIEKNFMPIMLMWDKALKDYRAAHQETTGEDRWLPYTEIIDHWHTLSEARSILDAQSKASAASKSLREKMKSKPEI